MSDTLMIPAHRFPAFLLPVLVTSCMVVGTNYTAPNAITPDYWHQAVAKDMNTTHSSLERWWTKFNDPTLNDLIDQALGANRTLAIAYERINEARASRGIARSALFPTATASGSGTQNKVSENIGYSTGGQTYDYWATGVDAGWEIDFFGGVRRSIEAADATVEGTRELYRDTMVSLLAEVALNYVQIRTLEERIRIANENIGRQQESVNLTKERFDAGLAPQLDVSQATTNLSNTKAVVPALRSARATAVNRLATLLGRYPGNTEPLLGKSSGIPMPANNASIGIPADLVRARPDIRAAERELAAQTAMIGVAQADLLPRFTLAGTFELQSLGADSLLQGNSGNYSFGPAFRWNIFSAGRIKNQIEVEESRTRQAYMAYEQAVLRGVEDVENSLATLRFEKDRRAALSVAVSSSQETVDLVNQNYKEGLIDFQNVLDAERTIATNQDSLAESEGVVAAAYVSLFKALGGGTPMPEAKVDANGKS
ncbi:MAG: efflux transporter outer membrane subunit [Verrucomicrobiota bacterium JB025]